MFEMFCDSLSKLHPVAQAFGIVLFFALLFCSLFLLFALLATMIRKP